MASEFSFIGGRLCLDFANAGGAVRSAEPEERYGALLRWSEQAGDLSRLEATALSHAAERMPDAAVAIADRAVQLAEAIQEIFSALAHGASPARKDLFALNAELAAALGHLRVFASAGRFDWVWSPPDEDLARVLWPVARSAADLLVGDGAVRLRTCDNETCNWLFIDSSRNGRRRWCDMKECGNRAKARRYRERHRASG